MNRSKSLVAALAVIVASPALAGEITGSGVITPIESRGVAQLGLRVFRPQR